MSQNVCVYIISPTKENLSVIGLQHASRKVWPGSPRNRDARAGW